MSLFASTNARVAGAFFVAAILHIVGAILIPGYSAPFAVRAMLVIEALLLAIVALALGFAMGIGFGWLGVISMPISDLVTASLHVPWLALLGVAAVTVLAAVLASVMPGRRAARSAPVEALAQA